jgi:hypothetical protein
MGALQGLTLLRMVWLEWCAYRCPLRGPTSSLLKQTNILTTNHWTKVEDPYGWIRVKIEGAEGESNSIGKPSVSTNLDPGRSQTVSHKPDSIEEMAQGPQHTYSRGLPGPTSVWEDTPILGETWGPREGRSLKGEHPLGDRGRRSGMRNCGVGDQEGATAGV